MQTGSVRLLSEPCEAQTPQAGEPNEPRGADSCHSKGSFTLGRNKGKDGAHGKNVLGRTLAVEPGLALMKAYKKTSALLIPAVASLPKMSFKMKPELGGTCPEMRLYTTMRKCFLFTTRLYFYRLQLDNHFKHTQSSETTTRGVQQCL